MMYYIKSKSIRDTKRRTVHYYFWETNAYNAVVITDGNYWICLSDDMDGIDLYSDNAVSQVKAYVNDLNRTGTWESFYNLYNDFSSRSDVAVGDNFSSEFPSSELTLCGTIYE